MKHNSDVFPPSFPAVLVALRRLLRPRQLLGRPEEHRDPGLPQQPDQPPPLHRHQEGRQRGNEEPDSLQGPG